MRLEFSGDIDAKDKSGKRVIANSEISRATYGACRNVLDENTCGFDGIDVQDRADSRTCVTVTPSCSLGGCAMTCAGLQVSLDLLAIEKQSERARITLQPK